MRLAFRPLPLPRVAHRLPAGRLGERFRGVLGEVEGDQAVAVAEPPVAGPHDGAGGDQFVEHRGSVVAHARRQDLGLPQGRRQRDARELFDRAEEAVHAPEGPAGRPRCRAGRSRTSGLSRPGRLRPVGPLAIARRGGQEAVVFEQEARIGPRGRRLGRVAGGLQRAGAQAGEDAGVDPLFRAPLRGQPAGVEGSGEEPAALAQVGEGGVHDGDAQPEVCGELGGRERRVGARIPCGEVPQGVAGRLQEGFGDPVRQVHGQGVAQRGRVLDRGPPAFPGDGHLDDPALLLQARQPCGRVARSGVRAGEDAFAGQRAEPAQQVGQSFPAAHAAARGQALELPAEQVGYGRVQDVGVPVASEQVGEQPAVQGQQGRAALGQGRVALVEELGHVAEQQVGGEGGGDRGGGLGEADPPVPDALHERREGLDVVDVVEAFARGLDEDGESGVLSGDLEELTGAQPLLPQRGPPAGVPLGQQEGTCRAFAEPRGEQGRSAHRVADQPPHVGRVEFERVRSGDSAVRVGHARDDPVVAGDDGRVDLPSPPDPLGDYQGPRLVDAAAVGRVQDDPPVARFVAHPFDDEPAVRGQGSGRLALLEGKGQQVGDCVAVQPRCGQALGEPAVRVPVCDGRVQVGQEPSDRRAEFDGSPGAVPAPEREARGASRCRGDDDPVVGDLQDPPRRGPQGDDVPHPGLVDHLLVEFADAARARGFLPLGQDHAVGSPVGDRPAAGHGQALRAGPGDQRPLLPVPHDARAEFGEVGGGIPPREHVEGRVEGAPGQAAEGAAATHEPVPGLGFQRLHRNGGHGLLGEDVQGVVRHLQRLDEAGAHAVDDDRGVQQVPARARVDDPRRDAADRVARASDALQSAGRRRGHADLDHFVHQAHVDSQLEAGGGHDASQSTRFQVALRRGAPLLGHRPVVGAGDPPGGVGGPPLRSAGLRIVGLGGRGARAGSRTIASRVIRVAEARGVQAVETGGQPLRQSAGIDEHDRGTVGEDPVEDARLDMRPDRARGRGLARGRAPVGAVGRAPAAVRPGAARRPPPRRRRIPVPSVRRRGLGDGDERHVLDRDRDSQVEPAAGGRVDDRHRRRAAEECGDLIDGSDGCRQSHALRRTGQQGVQALQADGEVGSPLRPGHRVDFVDDDRTHALQGFAGPGCEHEEEGFGRGDQDLRRASQKPRPLSAGCVAGAHPYVDARLRVAPPAAPGRYPLQRGSQVALHVGSQRLERRDVEDARGRGGGVAEACAGGVRSGGRQGLTGPLSAGAAVISVRGAAGAPGLCGVALPVQAVDGVHERRQGLARSGRGDDQRVVTGVDRRPRLDLHRRGACERGLEPVAHGRRERAEGVGYGHAPTLQAPTTPTSALRGGPSRLRAPAAAR